MNQFIIKFCAACLCFMLLISTQSVSAQTPAANGRLPDRITRPMIAVDPMTLQGEGLRIRLWGIKPAETSETPLELRALDLLDNIIGSEAVTCKIIGGQIPEVYARCTTFEKKDLALELLSEGLAVVDRRQTYNTVFASSYASAQETARLAGKGVWIFLRKEQESARLPQWFGSHTDIIFPFLVIGAPFIGLLIIGFMLRAGLAKLEFSQNHESEETRQKEAALQVRERQILLSTLQGELIENKNKIEAFLVIYKDMLRSLQSADESPKYQQVGDIIQKHPAFSRVVFDAHVGKLSLLDIKTAGQLSKLYASLPTEQEYVNLEPNVPLETAIALVEKVITEAEAVLPELDQTLTTTREMAASSTPPASAA